MDSEADNVRKVVLQDADYARLRDAFDDPSVQLLFVVSSHTGIRASELKRIRWDQVEFGRGVIALERGKTKNKDPRSAPIYGDMSRYLLTAKAQRDTFYPDSPWVFNRAGAPIMDFRGEWVKATKKAGIPELHFHDLRRTAQRLMRRAGIDRITRMRSMGHRTDAMDIRYGVVEDDDVVQAGAKLDSVFQTLLGQRNGNRNAEDTGAAGPSVSNKLDEETLEKLATVDSGKLKALLALIGN
jgi:integrase